MPYKARVAFYKMYSLLDKIFRPYVDFIRTQLLHIWPDLKDYIGVPPYYRTVSYTHLPAHETPDQRGVGRGA